MVVPADAVGDLCERFFDGLRSHQGSGMRPHQWSKSWTSDCKRTDGWIILYSRFAICEWNSTCSDLVRSWKMSAIMTSACWEMYEKQLALRTAAFNRSAMASKQSTESSSISDLSVDSQMSCKCAKMIYWRWLAIEAIMIVQLPLKHLRRIGQRGALIRKAVRRRLSCRQALRTGRAADGGR